jgi:hypothetical protein
VINHEKTSTQKAAMRRRAGERARRQLTRSLNFAMQTHDDVTGQYSLWKAIQDTM